MELKVINPNATFLNLAYGISVTRADELQNKMNAIMAESFRSMRLHEYLAVVAKFCDSWEEVVWCGIYLGIYYADRDML